ncbi:putative cyclic nucleotide-binding protein [Magnetofaba australis IT-1]|uniref:Putative cyclic nucleotide-binding protein n=2 Tax=Magnetofaba TaxID=1472292 RepID=A0A1Y2K299_9PROT|nr:putative cyclic nucleotide-binding protein [Magnetofaba australis IT-1]
MTVEPDAVILQRGEINDALYVILDGALRVLLDASDPELFIPIEAGQCVGDMSILEKSPVSAQVIAEQKSTLLILPEEHFWRYVMTVPMVARNLMRALSARVRKQDAQLLAKREQEMKLRQYERELGTARQIQASVLPTVFPCLAQWPTLRVKARMEPAREVGGDLYDLFALDEERMFFVIGDVSGKGAPAALFMMRAVTLFRTAARTHMTPMQMMQWVSDQLRKQNAAYLFITAICGVYYPRSGAMELANAGHLSPLLKDADGDVRYVEMEPGSLAGILPNAEFSTVRLTLKPGETMALYTDGVTEGMDPEGALFGEEHLQRTARITEGNAPEALLERIYGELADYTQFAVQTDDITMVAIQRAE